jgi:hypothetical protein
MNIVLTLAKMQSACSECSSVILLPSRSLMLPKAVREMASPASTSHQPSELQMIHLATSSLQHEKNAGNMSWTLCSFQGV